MAYLRAVVRCSLTPKFGSISRQSIPASSLGQFTFKSTQAASTVIESDRAVTDSPRRDPLDITFQDPYAAFKSKTTWEVVRAYIVYTLCSSEYLVENNMKVRNTELSLIYCSLPCYVDLALVSVNSDLHLL